MPLGLCHRFLKQRLQCPGFSVDRKRLIPIAGIWGLFFCFCYFFWVLKQLQVPAAHRNQPQKPWPPQNQGSYGLELAVKNPHLQQKHNPKLFVSNTVQTLLQRFKTLVSRQRRPPPPPPPRPPRSRKLMEVAWHKKKEWWELERFFEWFFRDFLRIFFEEDFLVFFFFLNALFFLFFLFE